MINNRKQLADAERTRLTIFPLLALGSKVLISWITISLIVGGLVFAYSSRAGAATTTPTPTWVQVQPATSPTPRFLASMAFDQATGNMVLFGGTNSNSNFSDTWTWNGNTWSNVTPSGTGTSPSVRYGASMDHDPANGDMTLFGGNGSSGTLNDTWVYQPVTSAPSAAPTSIGQSSSNGSGTITWVDVPTSSDGGSSITSYTAEILEGTSVISTTSVALGVQSATFTSLINGTSYTMKVAAINGVGTGPYATSAVVVPSAKPSAPTNVVATPDSNGDLSLTWSAGNDNGSTITSYTISVVSGVGTTNFPITTTSSATSLTIPATDFAPTNTYTLSVAATNANGTGTGTSSNSFVEPSAPSAALPQCSGIGVGSIRFPSGYWLASGNGAVYSCGDAPFYGSLVTIGVSPAHPIVGIASTPDNKGYWLVASDGGLFSFGSGAVFRGSMVNKPLDRPLVGMSVVSGNGYYEVASDGGVFSFGSAVFAGSLGGQGFTDIVGMANA